jgi:serine/threonine protein phosphatase PrpC
MSEFDNLTTAAAKMNQYHFTHINDYMKLLGKKQDQTYTGIGSDKDTGEIFDWMVVYDGHGNNDCINAIRKMDQLAHIECANPIESIAEYIINTINPKSVSGAVMSLVKIYADRIVCYSCGDSQILVLKNDKKIYMNQRHDLSNVNEKNRILQLHPENKIVSAETFQLIDDTNIQMFNAGYIHFHNNTRIAPTQAIGHGGMTACIPSVEVIPITNGDRFRVIVASDGLWDMLIVNDDSSLDLPVLTKSSGNEILDYVVRRWEKEWTLCDSSNNIICRAALPRNNYDDIALCIADIAL